MQFIRFLLIGGLNTVLYYLIYAISIFVGINYKMSVVNATIITIFISFFTFKQFVFKKNGYFYKFVLLQFFNMVINIVIIKNLRIYFNDYLSGFISLSIIAIVSFYINKKFIFKGENVKL